MKGKKKKKGKVNGKSFLCCSAVSSSCSHQEFTLTQVIENVYYVCEINKKG